MFVRDHMTTPAITLSPETPFQDTLQIMRDHKIRRIPIVDENQKLVEIVAERDLLQAQPSSATSLSIWEMNYLLDKLKLEEIMSREVITVTPLTTLQDAASLLIKHKIGGLPVIGEDERVVGVITETDIFKAFVTLLTTEQMVFA
jgi:acetoin utilization protein AcuB